MKIKSVSVAILGAGLSGLSSAYQLSKNEISVMLIEKDGSVGGLAKTIKKNGFYFDLGGHRFHTNKENILNEIKNLLGEDLLAVKRKSRIWIHGKFFDYPLQPLSAIFSFGCWKSAKIFKNYLLSFYRTKYKNPPEKSFEDWASNRFGKYLYEIYFKPYTEKVWGVSANEISKDWASSRIDLINLWDAIKKALFKLKDTPKTYLDWFYYPREGIGMIAESMANKIKARGNEILTGWKVSEIKYIDDRMESIIISSGQSCMEVKSDIFISTIPITELILLSGLAVPEVIREAVAKLKFRASIYVFLIIDKEKITDDTWLYFPEKEIIFSRLNEPKNWCKESSPSNDKTSLCCQIFCDQNDQTWNAKNEQLAKDCIHTLSQLGLLKEKDVLDHFVERSAYAYPLFQIDYNNHLKVANKFLSQFKNLHLIGRMGAFSYLNMDQVIEAGIEKANELLSNKR